MAIFETNYNASENRVETTRFGKEGDAYLIERTVWVPTDSETAGRTFDTVPGRWVVRSIAAGLSTADDVGADEDYFLRPLRSGVSEMTRAAADAEVQAAFAEDPAGLGQWNKLLQEYPAPA